MKFLKGLFNFRLTPTIMRQRLLEESERQMIDVAKNREHWQAMEVMLNGRIARLRNELRGVSE